MLTEFFTKNLDIVFMIYGLSFVVMAIAILIQPRRQSIFRLSDIIGLLAGFGVTHGLNEWLDMFNIFETSAHIHRSSYIFDITRLTILGISYIFLFEFGRRLVSLRVKKILNKWITVSLCFLTFVLGFILKEERSIWPRYFLGFPGGILSAIGFIWYYYDNKVILSLARVRKYFVCASVSIGIYGVLGGFIVPKGSFFPAYLINKVSFLKLSGIPVEVFRTLCASVLAWSVWNILRIFDWEIICELKSRTEEVTAARTFVSTILKSMMNSLVVVDENARIRGVNDATCELLGYKKDELLGKSAAELFEGDSPFEKTKLKKLIKENFLGNFELTYISKNKAKIPILFSESIMRNEKGEVIGYIGVGKDISESKILQEKLLRSEKLTAMGKAATMIGHEVKNQLGVMRNAVYYLNQKLQEKDEKIKKHLDILEDTIVETNEIIENVMLFSKTKRPELADMDLKNILTSSIDANQVPDEIKIETQIDKDLPLIRGDKIQLKRVFVNLILNAIEAMDGKGKLTIKAYREDNHINLEFLDTGQGISEENKKMIFEPFFSTKASGMGLGLTTSNLIIQAHGGNIDLKSQKDKGTTVIIKLPIK